jgi:TorA maturation chaperone TorD
MELFRALAALAEPPSEGKAGRLSEALGLGAPPTASEYAEVFVFQLYPYASVYLGAEGMMGGEARERVAGFWRALGQTPPSEADHISTLLSLYAGLAELEEAEGEASRREGWRGARKALLWEHLLSWLFVYLEKLSEVAPPFYRGWGELLKEALLAEASAVGAQEALPAHLREARALADPREAAVEEFLQTLLAPARSGMILVRSDLSRAARSLGLGARAGERKFTLKSLLGQDAAGVLGWLAGEASAWTARHRAHGAALGAVAGWWESRALETAALLGELAGEARETAANSEGLPE